MKKQETVNILFCGIGGQGVLSAAEICAKAAINDGFHAKKSEVHGMSQRGGSVESHVRYGKEVFSPLIPYAGADYLVAFQKNEGENRLGYLAQQGRDLIPLIDRAALAVTNKKLMNTFILGALSVHLGISRNSWEKAVKEVFSEKHLKENLIAFDEGRRAVQ
ncbi:MAG: indolepyruvate oxidoreductase subunit beta [Candidatus Margulisiibacteriota bacterium]